MAVPYSFFVVYFDRFTRRPTIRQASGEGPPPQNPRRPGQPPVTEPLEIAETREAVRSDVFGTSGYPQMLLRVGWALVNADPLPPTPRRQLSDVVEWSIQTEPKVFA
jgi:hypothetical protein